VEEMKEVKDVKEVKEVKEDRCLKQKRKYEYFDVRKMARG